MRSRDLVCEEPCPACGTDLALTDDGFRQRKAGRADIQPEVPEPEVQQAAASPMQYQSQQDDGEGDQDKLDEEHHYARDRVPAYLHHGTTLAGAGPIAKNFSIDHRTAEMPLTGICDNCQRNTCGSAGATVGLDRRVRPNHKLRACAAISPSVASSPMWIVT